MRGILWVAFAFLSIGLPGQSRAEVEKIPTEIFAAEGDVYRPLLSPDGSQMVYRQNAGGKTFLTIRTLSDDKLFSTAMPEGTDLNWYRWAGNGQILFSVSSLKQYFNEFRQVEMYLIDSTTRKTRYIGVEDGGPDGDNVLHLDPDGRFLILEIRESVYKYPAVYRINLATNEAEQVVGDQMRVMDWVADNTGQIRMGISYRRSSTLVFYRSSDTEKFRRIDKVKDTDIVDKEEEPLLDGFTIIAGSDEGYVLSNEKTGRFALYRFNVRTREIGEKVFDHDEYELTRFTMTGDCIAGRLLYGLS